MNKFLFCYIFGFAVMLLPSCGYFISKSSENKSTEKEFGLYQVIGIVPGIEKFVIKYSDQLFRGGKPYSDEGFEQLKKFGVNTIVSITPDKKEFELAEKHKIKLIEIPFYKYSPVPEEIKRKFLNLFNHHNRAIFLHGNESTSRAGILGALYRLKICEWPYGKTMMEFQQLGGDINQDKIMIDSIKK